MSYTYVVHPTYKDEITKLRRLNDELRERVKWLEGQLRPGIDLNAPVNLSPMEADVLLALYNAQEGATLSEDNIAARCKGDYIGTSVKVVVCHLRRKLSAHGLEITTKWGRGYKALSGDSRATVKQWITA
jgi:DNA-binding response OmpR family regulator